MKMTLEQLNEYYEVDYFPAYFVDTWVNGNFSYILTLWSKCNTDAKTNIIDYMKEYAPDYIVDILSYIVTKN